MAKNTILSGVSFGQRVAEDEADFLGKYFVETDHWSKLYRGDVDVIYGPKGAGKSALYTLLNSKAGELFDKGILLIAAENPRGAPAFRGLLADPPASEREFVGLWKLYFASLLHHTLAEFEVKNTATKQLEEALATEGLIKGTLSLGGLLKGVAEYVRRVLNPRSLEGGIEIDPVTLQPTGFKGSIVFSELGKEDGVSGFRSVDKLLQLADTAFTSSRLNSWILLDRLDVAFAENVQLEENALKALFRVYLDLLGYDSIKLKIFLRTDIWSRITESGFREASHITKTLTIDWDRNALLNLIIRRVLFNESMQGTYQVTANAVLDSVDSQKILFYKIFPDQVDIGSNKPETLDWILTRTRDGSKVNAPRELIHFLNSLRDTQVRRFERGETEPSGDVMFERISFKEALPEVSKVRLEQTIYAEYPSQKEKIERLRGEKTKQTPTSLSSIFNVSVDSAVVIANSLAGIGLFELRGTKSDPEYWVPFLYRDALDLIQGTAE